MCGIVGLFLKSKSLEAQLGPLFSEMLPCMSGRGPDSAGIAVYGDEAPAGSLKFTLHHAAPGFDWTTVSGAMRDEFNEKPRVKVHFTHAVFSVAIEEEPMRRFLTRRFPGVNLMSIGQRMEIMKEVGPPATVMDRFQVRQMSGTHAIGHTRMATESAVTTEGSHPFSTAQDVCLVHNGSLSNHNRLRRNLEQEGLRFQTRNDSEVAAGFLSWRLGRGDTLEEALHEGLRAFDGFFTLTVGTRNGFAVLRDRIACKPAIMAETDDYVAMSSEYRSLTSLPGIEKARLWEPEPATVYSWSSS